MAEETPEAESPVKETLETPVPSVTETEQKTPETPVDTGKQDGLPEEASDRTKHEFDKVQSQLREEPQRREALESAFKSIQEQSKPEETKLAPIYTADGYIDESAMAQRDRLLIQATDELNQTKKELAKKIIGIIPTKIQ